MLIKIIILLLIFVFAELIANYTIFKYIKKKFVEQQAENKRFLKFNLSTFKGILERFVLLVALVMNLPQALIVFGTLKIGSRFDRNQKVQNDYFIVGNFTSLLLSIMYLQAYKYAITLI